MVFAISVLLRPVGWWDNVTFWHSLSQVNDIPFFTKFEKGWHFWMRSTMNLHISCPCKPLTLIFFFFGDWMFWIVFILFESMWILMKVTTNLRNFLLEVPRNDLLSLFLIDEHPKYHSEMLDMIFFVVAFDCDVVYIEFHNFM